MNLLRAQMVLAAATGAALCIVAALGGILTSLAITLAWDGVAARFHWPMMAAVDAIGCAALSAVICLLAAVVYGMTNS